MAPSPVCISCKKNRGRLGAAPNKYCYRKGCVAAGKAAGHIKQTGQTPPHRPAQGNGDDDDDDTVPTSTFEISEIKNLLGLR